MNLDTFALKAPWLYMLIIGLGGAMLIVIVIDWPLYLIVGHDLGRVLDIIPTALAALWLLNCYFNVKRFHE